MINRIQITQFPIIILLVFGFINYTLYKDIFDKYNSYVNLFIYAISLFSALVTVYSIFVCISKQKREPKKKGARR